MNTEDGGTLSAAQATRLATWLSPSFPIGAYAYSHGLERAVEFGSVRDEPSLLSWLVGLLEYGSARNEVVLFGSAYTAARDLDEWIEVAELGAALRPSAEFGLEAEAQGAAFVAAVLDAWPCDELRERTARLTRLGIPITLPVAVGTTCRLRELPRVGSATLYLHSFLANLVSAGVRLIPLGQAAGQRVLASLEPAVVQTAASHAHSGPEDVGSSTPRAEILSMQHETQHTRLFRS